MGLLQMRFRLQQPQFFAEMSFWYGGCRMKAGLKSGVLRVVFCFCKSPVTVGTKGGYYYMPSPAGKGDREAVDEENILWQL